MYYCQNLGQQPIRFISARIKIANNSKTPLFAPASMRYRSVVTYNTDLLSLNNIRHIFYGTTISRVPTQLYIVIKAILIIYLGYIMIYTNIMSWFVVKEDYRLNLYIMLIHNIHTNIICVSTKQWP